MGSRWYALSNTIMMYLCSRIGTVRAIECPVLNMEQLVHRVGVDEDLLKKECSENSLKKIAPLLPDWLTYAKALGFTEPETRDITDNPQLSNSTHAMKALRVLEKWHRRHAFNATYHHLVKVCLDLGHLTIATEICKIVKGWSHFQLVLIIIVTSNRRHFSCRALFPTTLHHW